MSKLTALLILCVVSISYGVQPDITGEAEKTAYKSGVSFGENKSGISGAPVFNVKMQGDSAIIQQDGLAKGSNTSLNENDPKPTKEDLLKGAEKKEKKKDKTLLWILLALLLLLIGAVVAYYLSRRDDDDKNGTGTNPGDNGGGSGNCGGHNNNGNHNGWTNGQGHQQHGNGQGNGHQNHCPN